MKFKKTLILIFIILLLAGFIFIKYRKKNTEPTIADQKTEMFSGPRPVKIKTVGLYSSISERVYPGVVEAKSEVDLSFRVSGPVIKINFRRGDKVRAGQVLMQVDPRDYLDAIESTKAKLIGARAALSRSSNDYARVIRLFADKYSSRAEYENIESRYLLDQADLKEYENKLVIAQHKLEDTTLKAPFDGIIIDKFISKNEMISAGSVALQMHDISSLEIAVDIPEIEMSGYKLGTNQYALASFPAIGPTKYKARMREWKTAANKDLGSYVVTFVMKAPAGQVILPGMTAEIAWQPTNKMSIRPLSVPFSAIVPNAENQDTVWVYDPATKLASQRIIQIAPGALGKSLPVIAGLEPGEQVVTAGVNHINSSMQLRSLEK